MQKFWVTFGSGHEPYGNSYTIMEAESEGLARAELYRHICTHWCTTYANPSDGGIDRYALEFVPWEQMKLAPPQSSRYPAPCFDCIERAKKAEQGAAK